MTLTQLPTQEGFKLLLGLQHNTTFITIQQLLQQVQHSEKLIYVQYPDLKDKCSCSMSKTMSCTRLQMRGGKKESNFLTIYKPWEVFYTFEIFKNR